MIETPAEILSHAAGADAAEDFVMWRKKLRKPLTERAAKMIAKTLAAINAEGGDATEALDMAQEHGWQTIKPDWYWRQKNGNRGSASSGDTISDASTRQISFAARAVRSPSSDCF